jgi:predicted RNA binding protein YcfA (HicA-like mRNA interferase family)
MPPKLKELIKKLESAGFINRGGKGSHRNFKHPKGVNITISGNPGSDAKPYQENDVKKALERIKKDEKK